MSLLESGPHTVTVYPKLKVKDVYNSWTLSDGPPIVIERVAVQPMGFAPTQPVSEAVNTNLGEQVRSNLRVIGRGIWPGGPHSRVVFDGRDYDQQGEAAQYGMSPRTAHFSIVIQARSAEVK